MPNYNILFMAQPIYAEVENITPPEHVYFVLEEFSSMDSDPPVYAEIEDFGNRAAVPPPLESVVYTDVEINY